MRAGVLRALVASVAAASALAAWAEEGGAPRRLLLPSPSGRSRAAGDTRCEACHSTKGWSQAAFDHDRTGFPLRGGHSGAACKGCHTTDLTTPLPRSCAACHQDAHRGDFGKHCQSCHSEENWRPFFDAAAHRRTNFPLVGAHAAVPCQECHTDMTDRKFVRSAVQCVGCHAADYGRAAAVGIDHLALGFPTGCADCHTAIAFRGAHFPAHEVCFQIGAGAHSTIDCLGCHTSLAGARVTGTCQTGTAACSACHAHACAAMDKLHAGLRGGTPPGYQCQDLKCYRCHEFVGAP